MNRPPVTVVMPFAGTREQAAAALIALSALSVAPGDELIFADNSGVAAPADGVILVAATGERSPARARNAGAERAANDWILFLDADVRAPADLLDRFFATPIADDVGALTGSVLAAAPGGGLAERYGASRGFLRQEAHLAHPFMPRAAAANLLVRRVAFEQVGGFLEGVRAAEDTDFSWRLQRAGWRLAGRPEAAVDHQYRTSLRALRRQWRGYAAGRAWLSRRYDGFEPEPALRRGMRRALARARRRSAAAQPEARAPRSAPDAGPLERASFAVLDAVLGVEELAGLTLSNRPARPRVREPVRVVLVAERFPAVGDPLVALATQLAGARVEAGSRPPLVDRDAARRLWIDYREDDGRVNRAVSLARLLMRHPARCAADLFGRSPGDPGLAVLAPAVTRLRRDRDARLHALGPRTAAATRLARLAGRPLEG